MTTERRPVPFNRFGGLRLDLPLDEIGGEQAQYLRDVDWDGNTGRLRPRDGFQKLKATDATGPYKALFPHSNLRLLATKRVKASEVKIVAIDKDGEEKTSHSWPETAATFCATRFGTPSASYSYCRADLATAAVVRFDGTVFTEPTCSVDGTTGKAMPKGKVMASWPDGGNRLIVANTGSTGGPGAAASSASHVWFSGPGNAESYESTAYVQLSPGDGEEITAIAVFNSQVFVFKETKFFVFYGVSVDEEGRPVFAFREVSLGEGGRMKRPVVEALAESSDQLACVGPEGVYFCTSAGVYVTTGSTPTKISQALRPLEEISPFDGPMAEFLNGETEVFRWPATGIACLGTRLVVRRYEFMFVLDLPTGEWTCWKMTAVSMAIWTGLTGGGAETEGPAAPGTAAESGSGSTWKNLDNIKVADTTVAMVHLENGQSSKLAEATAYDLSIPTDATVTGIQGTFWTVSSYNGAGLSATVWVVKDGVVETVLGGATAISTAPRTEHRVGGTEVLPVALTPEDLNGGASGLALGLTNSTGHALEVGLDALLLTVYYVTAEAASGVRPRLYCAQAKSIFVTTPSAEEDAGTRVAEWQSGFYDMGNRDEKELVGVRAFGTGAIDAQSFSDFDDQPSPSEGHFVFPASGSRSVLDDNALTQSGVMFSHKLSLEPGSKLQSIDRYLRETRTPGTKGR
jgi:hypothetical protein